MNFEEMKTEELVDYIKAVKTRIGKRMLIPAHHYVKDEVVDLADFVGDSYKLAVDVSRTDAEFIVFAGVLFMAEGASILAGDRQKVILPELTAGCPMADMINGESSEGVLVKLEDSCENDVVPVVYMNSYLDAKVVCGKWGGSVCTSSNAEKIVNYFLDQGKSVFFFPDYHLGKNTANKLGIPEDQIVKVNRDLSTEDGKNVSSGKIFLWDGFCHVHQSFDVEDVKIMREKYPEGKIIVHPEVSEFVVKASDYAGSTQQIYNMIEEAPSGTTWVVGTEYNFVMRLARDMKDKTIVPLKDSPCVNMTKVNLVNTARAIESVSNYIETGNGLINEIKVGREKAAHAKAALDRMIEISEK